MKGLIYDLKRDEDGSMTIDVVALPASLESLIIVVVKRLPIKLLISTGTLFHCAIASATHEYIGRRLYSTHPRMERDNTWHYLW